MPTQSRLTDRKRAAILTAAVQVFHDHGFDNASMDHIAEVAEVSKRTVYNHFESKEKLFVAIVDQLKSNAHAAAPISYAEERPLDEQLTSFLRSVIDFHSRPESRRLARVVVSKLLSDPTLAQELFGNAKIFEETLLQWMNQAQEANRLKSFNTAIVARQVLAMLETFCIWPQLLRDAEPPNTKLRNQVVHEATSMFLSCYAQEQ
jgi:TetR/AcrR family transcriptional regulator, regulator of autoinduction and epiphytic fitness